MARAAIDLDVINIGLVALGDVPLTAAELSGNSNETARKVNAVYDDLRETMLSEHPWNFATQRVTLPDAVIVQLLLHCNGADAATAFVDEAGKTVTVVGTAQIDTAQSVFGGASALFDGNSDYLTLVDSDDFDFDDKDFTIDLRARFDSSLSTLGLFGQYEDTDNLMFCYADVANNALHFGIYVDGTQVISLTSTNITLAVDTWYQIAVVRRANVWTLYLDGVIVNTESNTVDYPNLAAVFQVGRTTITGGTQYYMSGWIDEFRVTNGVAQWATTFTPPTAEYGPILVSSEPNWGFSNIHELPVDILKPLKISVSGDEFKVEDNRIYSYSSTVELKYIRRVLDVTKYSESFVIALAAELAAVLTYPITHDKDLVKINRDLADAALSKAKALDGQGGGTPDDLEANEWILARFTGGEVPLEGD